MELKNKFDTLLNKYKEEDRDVHREYMGKSVIHSTSPRSLRKKHMPKI